jgi:hypothetical protein
VEVVVLVQPLVEVEAVVHQQMVTMAADQQVVPAELLPVEPVVLEVEH